MYRTQTTRMPSRMHHVGYSRRGLGGRPGAFLQESVQRPSPLAAAASATEQSKAPARRGALVFGSAGKRMMAALLVLGLIGGLAWRGKDLLMAAAGDVSRD